MRKGNEFLSNTSNEPNLTKAFRDFQLYLNRNLFVISYLGGRAKYPDMQKGVVSMMLRDQVLNEKRNYGLLYRYDFWDKWRQHCGLLTVLPQPKYKFGFTVTKNIYDEMVILNEEFPTKLVIRLPDLIYWYSISTLKEFVAKYDPVSNNQNDMDRPLEYGFPAMGIDREYVIFEGNETYE